MAKPDDMPKLVSDDRFKVEALETTARTPGLLSYVRQYLSLCSQERMGGQLAKSSGSMGRTVG